MLRKTKIVATLGPATDHPEVLEKMIEAGVNVVRLNFSHGTAQEQIARAQQVREIAQKLRREVGVLADLQGPKIRVSSFKERAITLLTGEHFALDITLGEKEGDQKQVGVTYKALLKDLKPTNQLLLDDGKIVLEVLSVSEQRAETVVKVGGELSDHKGINLLGGGLSAPALTEKDKRDLICAASFEADFLAVSFPRSAQDIEDARLLLQQAGSQAAIIAKIERVEAVENMDEIILASDGIMVARGDLAVEIGDAKLMGVQKRLIQRSRQLNRVVITATQMMESMIQQQTPTRAEVMDVANAVLDGTDAVMLSGESAVGLYPVKTVQAMAAICVGAESDLTPNQSNWELLLKHQKKFERTDEAIAMASILIANNYDIEAIACLTETGMTAILMSRMSSARSIFAFTRHQSTCRRLTLCRGVQPIEFPVSELSETNLSNQIVDELKRQNVLQVGEQFLLTRGALNFQQGGTNSLNIIQVDH